METKQYIGIPFLDHGRNREGCDCYGLVFLVYREQFGIALPDLGDGYSCAYERGEVDATAAEALSETWNRDVTAEPWKAGDVMVFRRAGVEAHVGLYVRPGYMLHVVAGQQTTLERYDTSVWKNRLSRVVRHVDAS
jgi:cell wall-associated NlpC family hydrolase